MIKGDLYQGEQLLGNIYFTAIKLLHLELLKTATYGCLTVMMMVRLGLRHKILLQCQSDWMKFLGVGPGVGITPPEWTS